MRRIILMIGMFRSGVCVEYGRVTDCVVQLQHHLDGPIPVLGYYQYDK
jgi:hypothetical protein